MRLWLERFVLTICAAVVISLTILNPLKLDWQQRVSLALAVSAFAYFIGHTLHKPTAAPVLPDPRITHLEQQVQSLQSQQQQLAAQEASKEKERARRHEVRKQIAVFIDEGQKIQKDLEFNMSWFSLNWRGGALRLVRIPPCGRGFSRHRGLSIR